MILSRQIKSSLQIPILTLLVAFCVFLSGCAEKKEKEEKVYVYKVGILSGVEAFADTAKGFKAKMAELGYIEGKNIVYDLHKLNDDPAGEKRISQKFVDDKVDLILAFPTEAALSAKAVARGTGVPVVFAFSQTQGIDLVESVRRPGANITGVRHFAYDLLLKEFEILLELVPSVKRIWMVYDPKIVAASGFIELLRPIADRLDVTLVETHISNMQDLEAALRERESLPDIGIDAIKLMPDATTNSPDAGLPLMIKFAKRHKIPIASLLLWQVEAGALCSFSLDPIKIGGLAALLADKILKGTPAGIIPVVTADGSLWINYKVAQELGFKLDEGILSRADRILR